MNDSKLLSLEDWENLSAGREALGSAIAPRIVLYSHDTMGLGHKRRNLLIAQTLLAAFPKSSILLISGIAEAQAQHLPTGIDYLNLPALTKQSDGSYAARRLGLGLADITLLRAKTIRAAVDSFNPDLLLVDNVPRGANRELDLTLDFLQRRRPQTRCVLGLRDVLDHPSVVQQQWQQANNYQAIAQHYDALWVYGDPAVYDLMTDCQFPAEVAAKARYLGYLNGRQRLEKKYRRQPRPEQPLALCLVGGGQDGFELAQAFVQARLPTGWQGRVIMGPLMPQSLQQQLQQQAAARPELSVMAYVSEPTRWIQQASAVVSMGGYNTTCEVLGFGVRSLIVPRVVPRQEQWIRAARLQELGAIELKLPTEVTPEELSSWLVQGSAAAAVCRRSRVDMRGLERLPDQVGQLLSCQLLNPQAS